MSQDSSALILIGPTGAGKTTVGRLLALKIGVPFFDMDEEIEARCGADISWIFDVEGEAGFRNREARVLKELAAFGRVVVSCGAGVVLRPNNRVFLKSYGGLVIWLQVDLKTQVDRLKNDKSRPLLKVSDPRAKLRSMAVERESFYRECSGIRVQTKKANPSVLVRLIIEQIKEAYDTDT